MPGTSDSFPRSRRDNLVSAHLPFRARFQGNEHAAVVDRRTAPARADERSQRRYRRIGEDNPGDFLLQLRHRGERDVLGGVGRAHDDAGVLLGEEALGHGPVKDDRGHQRQERTRPA